MTAKSKTAKTRRPQRPTAARGYRPYPTPWMRGCGFCGRTTEVVTDGRMNVCRVCGH